MIVETSEDLLTCPVACSSGISACDILYDDIYKYDPYFNFNHTNSVYAHSIQPPSHPHTLECTDSR